MAMAVDYAPGVVLSAVVAAIGYVAAPYVAHVAPIPNMVIALVVGIALNPIAARPAGQPGMAFCVRTVLRWAVALLGLRVGLADIAALGLGTAALIVAAMAATVVSGFVIARWYGRGPGFGALVGVGTAVCGASATLACSTVVPDYKGKQPDIAFVVVAVNALATLAMAGCATHYSPNTDVDDNADNRKIIAFCERYRHAVEQNDLVALVELLGLARRKA